VPGVVSVHDLHVWSVASDKPMLSAHLMVKDLQRWQTVHSEARELLHERYGIEHVTLQPEPSEHVIRLVARRESTHP
jgi:cobalt-zinc-cadmium efflux system protein